jgi:3-oxoacyl-[acyl-carrier-protein] synthase-1
MGSGGGSPANQIEAADILREQGHPPRGAVPGHALHELHRVCLPVHQLRVKGINYSITSACSTSAHCIGAAAQQIAWGMQDVMFAGGGEEVTWGMACCLTPWAPCPAPTTTRPRKPRAPTTPTATAS